jgi:antitoxin ParD1/3/4
MNVSLTPRLEDLVKQKVKSGLYTSSSEVVREALRLLDERDRLRNIQLGELREAIQEGLESAPAGTLDIEAVKAEGRNRLANG